MSAGDELPKALANGAPELRPREPHLCAADYLGAYQADGPPETLSPAHAAILAEYTEALREFSQMTSAELAKACLVSYLLPNMGHDLPQLRLALLTLAARMSHIAEGAIEVARILGEDKTEGA